MRTSVGDMILTWADLTLPAKFLSPAWENVGAVLKVSIQQGKGHAERAGSGGEP